MIPRAARELYSLIEWWWTSDRIRVSPAEGRWLKIKPGDLLSLEGIEAEVLERRIIANRSVSLTCRTPSGLGELRVEISRGCQPPDLSWSLGSSQHMLDDSEVQVWPRRRAR